MWCALMCYSYGADLKNSRVELHLNIDGDLFAHVHVAKVALDSQAGSVRSRTKLQKDKVTADEYVRDAFLVERLVYCKCVMQEAELYHYTLGDLRQVEHQVFIKGSFINVAVVLQRPAAVLHVALALSCL